MAVSVVNGFLCFNSCDVKKAMQGVNPHPKQDPANPTPQSGADISGWPSPAVELGGALKASRHHQVTPVAAGEAPNAVSRNQTSTFETVA